MMDLSHVPEWLRIDGLHRLGENRERQASKAVHRFTKRLDLQTAREIKGLAATGMRDMDIAARFGVSKSSVGAIRRGQTWKNA